MDDIWERNGRKGPSLDRRSLLAAGATVPFVGVPAMAASPTLGAHAIDWAAFLARHDLPWDRLPRTWGEAPFLGNGPLHLSTTAAQDGAALSLAGHHVAVFHLTHKAA